MFATIIRTALFYTVLFTLFRTEFFQYPDAFKNLDGGVYLKRIYNKITKPICYHYCFYATMTHAAGDSSVVRAPDSRLKGPGFKSL